MGLAGGAALMVLFRVLDRLIGLISVALLARLLTPADFGLVAMATSVVGLIELMGAFGFDTALIQRPDAQRKHFDTAWTFQVCFGAASGVLLLAIAYPASLFYNDPRIAWILPVLALTSVINGLANIGPVMFRKELDFAREFRFLLAKRLVGFVATLVTAFLLRDYWALVVGIFVGTIASLIVSYAVHPYRPRLTLEARDELLHFSKWLLVSNLLQYIQGSTDKLVLGRVVGPQDLGLYNLASEVAQLPGTAVIAPMNRAIFPAYAELNGNLPALEQKFLSVIGYIAAAALPLSLGLGVLAVPAVELLLGAKWIAAVPLLQMFVVSGLVGAMQSNLYSLITALGHPRLVTGILAILACAYLPGIVLGSVYFGVRGAATAHMVVSVLGLIPLHIAFFRLTRFSRSAYVRRLVRPVVAACVAVGLTHLALGAMDGWPTLVVAVVGSGVFGLAYVASMWVLWAMSGFSEDSTERDVVVRLRGWAGRSTA